ncbi:NAD(P)-binding protein [Massarina eburnea CBS 473.64]|uniref:NAD(P)-binding protein n=1 Tax=Massarina eburnea CBS 473.64 TaxID=1395130 RepID=A0A6A6RYZ2_9PLEO|nr:NAD(P)-binding protein [Massarina eburnea CBS 473.64]
MTSFTIADSDLAGVKDKVVIITASSGIGLETLNLLLQHDAKVFAGDLNPLPYPQADTVPFKQVNVTSWTDQLELFKAAYAKYSRIDHVFANAGVNPTTYLLEDDVDEKGDLLPPNLRTIDINLTGVIYTVKLGIHYLKKNAEGGSIVMTASASSFSRFPVPDYTASKHGVLGVLRALSALLPEHDLPIRINAISPSWTATAIIPEAFAKALEGVNSIQTPDVAARSAVVCMADAKRNGECVYSEMGKFFELENGVVGMHARIAEMVNLESVLSVGLKAAAGAPRE